MNRHLKTSLVVAVVLSLVGCGAKSEDVAPVKTVAEPTPQAGGAQKATDPSGGPGVLPPPPMGN